MKPAKNPVADHMIMSVVSGVSRGKFPPRMKQPPVVKPPKAITVLRTRNRSDSQPEMNTLKVNTIQKYDVIDAARAGSR